MNQSKKPAAYGRFVPSRIFKDPNGQFCEKFPKTLVSGRPWKEVTWWDSNKLVGGFGELDRTGHLNTGDIST